MSVQLDSLRNVPGLGPFRSLHAYSTYARNNRFIFSGLTVLGALACTCMTMYAIYDDAQRAASSSSESSPGSVFMCAGLAWLLGGVLIFVLLSQWWRQRKFAVALYDGGIVISDLDGKIFPFKWSDIRSCQALVSRRGMRQYILELQSGQKVVFHPNLENLKPLGDAIIQNLNAARQ